MELRKNLTKGLTIVFIYIIIMMCILMATDRIERLDQTDDFRNKNESVVLKLNK